MTLYRLKLTIRKSEYFLNLCLLYQSGIAFILTILNQIETGKRACMRLTLIT
ncbi:MAG: hypothetical protein ACJAXM_001172 [Arenicella sp.]|jgi:hypothetical protein